MRNDECITYIYHKDKLVNTWYKEKEKWTLISAKGNVHYATAEQFLSHLLPAIMKEDYMVKVAERHLNR
jgi:hypothetical protein